MRTCHGPITAALVVAAVGSVLGGACVQDAHAQSIKSARIASGLARPIYLTHAPGDPTRMFVIEKQGRVRVIKDGTLLATPFIDIDPLVTGGTSTNSEQGLLGLAFHPDYQTNGKFYLSYTAVAGSGDTVVAEYTVSANPDIANTAQTTVITYDQPQANHNGGWIGFGPDGFMYVASGDGGNANDQGTGHTEPGGNAQDINKLLGKILRIDVNGDDFPGDTNKNYRIPPSNPYVGVAGADENFHIGLRNPWRMSFDRMTGDIWIGDVGQNAWEEIDFIAAGTPGGVNFGWRCFEGNATFNFDSVCTGKTFTPPIWVYDHSGKCSVTGGYVYRGCAIPELSGTYFFAEYCSNQIWSMQYTPSSGVVGFTERTAQLAPGGGLSIGTITSFGEDYFGEIYICDQGTGAANGEIYKILPVTAGLDTDNDGVANTCEIDGCPADFDNTGFVDTDDYDAFVEAFEAGDESADVDASGFVDTDDFDAFVEAYEAGC
jgi:glucose/arabinose dehydrogenase